MKKITILILASLLAFASCKKDDEDVTPIPVINEITENITVNTTWTTGSTYIVEGTINIDGATLTIQPGTIIKFKDGAQLEVGSYQTGSAIIANGTVTDQILFTSYAATPTAGDWDAIFFESGTASTTSFKFCTFEYGGGYSSAYGTIDLSEAEITMENCTVRNSASYGISLDSDSKFKSFTNNAILNTASHLIKLYPNAAHTIGAGNILSPINSSLGILVSGGIYNQAEETWLAQTVSYIIDGTMDVEHNAGSILNIQEGTSIGFTNGSQIEVGSSSSTYGTIKALGTQENPITFTSSAASKTAGDWDAIFLENGTSNSSAFTYCNFEYGGGYSYAYGMIAMLDCSVSFDNCTFTNSETYGVSLNSESSFTSFSNNTFSTCVNHPISIYGNFAHTVGTGNTYNSNLGIIVRGDGFNHASETWKKQSCAYYIDGTLDIESSTGSILTIEAGNKIFFTSGSQIEVGSASSTYGKLVAIGTPTERIIFSSGAPAGSASAGDWDAIFFEDGTSAGSILDFCDISYGGGYSSVYGAIDIQDNGTNVTVSNCNISYSASHGISYQTLTATPTLTSNTYSNITGVDVHQY